MIIKILPLLALFAATFSQVYAKNMGGIAQTTLYDHERGFKYPMGELEAQAKLQGLSKKGALKTNQSMADIKYYIISGNLNMAKLLLLHAKYQGNFSKPIQYRYLSLIHFIEGNFQESLDYLNKPELQKFKYLKKNCLLKSLNLTILNKTKELELYWPRCREATLGYTDNLHLWIETLISLKVLPDPENIKVPFKALAIENTQGDFLRIYLKLALYLNQQSYIFPRLPYLSIDIYKSDELRELIGLLFYREGKLVSTYTFIEDLDSPNSENIKGNIYLAQKKYELAYAQFKLALQKKSNSINALERTIPVSWKLRQWEDGVNFLNKFDVLSDKKPQKSTLMGAFLVQLGQYDKARDYLLNVVNKSRNGQSAEVNKLLTYSYMMLKDKHQTTKYANESCKQKDGLGCWLDFQLETWEDFTLTAHRDSPIIESKSNLANELKNEFTADPIKEPIFISQKDIEELENAQINLLPSK